MKIKHFVFTIFLILHFFVVYSVGKCNIVLTDSIPCSTYRILKIHRVKNVYEIYAQKDSVIYKIVSIREKIQGKTKIRKNRTYEFVLYSFFDNNDFTDTRVNSVLIDFALIKLEKTSRTLYYTNNLKGLYYIAPKP